MPNKIFKSIEQKLTATIVLVILSPIGLIVSWIVTHQEQWITKIQQHNTLITLLLYTIGSLIFLLFIALSYILKVSNFKKAFGVLLDSKFQPHCPQCNKILSVSIDPIAIKTEIVKEIMANLRSK